MDDSALLRQFAQTRSHAAFRDLVGRYTSLVYASALTRLRDAHAAQDVTQAVFLTLALKAKDLRPDTSLPGWLFTTTRYVAARYQRGEQRRQEREMRAFEQHQLHPPEAPAAVWEDLRPHLAGALDSLSGADREAVLLRFYRQASHRDVAAALRVSEEAAKKRVNRALEKLRCFLTKKGVTLSVAALAGGLTASASAAPAGLAGVVSAAVLTGAGGTLAATETLMLAKGALHAMFIAKIKTVSLTAAACLVVGGTGVVAAKQLAGSSMPTAVQQQVGAPVVTPVPVSPPMLPEPAYAVAETQPPQPQMQSSPETKSVGPTDYKPVQLTRGTAVGMRNNAGRWSCRVALEKPFNNLTELDVFCCNPPAIILLDGKPTTFGEAVAPGRHLAFDHVRGATPYISVSSEATKRSPLTWAEIIQKADAAAPGWFADHKPTGGTRDIHVSLDKNGQYAVTTINMLTLAGTKQETGRARVTLDADGNLVGQVETSRTQAAN